MADQYTGEITATEPAGEPILDDLPALPEAETAGEVVISLTLDPVDVARRIRVLGMASRALRAGTVENAQYAQNIDEVAAQLGNMLRANGYGHLLEQPPSPAGRKALKLPSNGHLRRY